MVEIDTKEIRMRRGVLLKHRATSLAAARFLAKTITPVGAPAEVPEIECPLSSAPTGTHHEEFYQADSDQPPRPNPQLRHWEHSYNCVRLSSRSPISPHWNSSLVGKTIRERQSVTNLLDEYINVFQRGTYIMIPTVSYGYLAQHFCQTTK